MRWSDTLGGLVAAVTLVCACSGSESKGDTSNASGAGGGAAQGGGSGRAGNSAAGESGAPERGGMGGGSAAGSGGSANGGSCLAYCDAGQEQSCATVPLADCQNYCRQSFAPECPEAKEVLYRCILDSDSVCMDKHACDDEYQSFMAHGCQGRAK